LSFFLRILHRSRFHVLGHLGIPPCGLFPSFILSPMRNAAVEVKRAGAVKWPDGLRAIVINLHIVDRRRTRLLRRIGAAVLPHAVRDDVWNAGIVYQCDALTFLNGYRCLVEVVIPHMNLWARSPAGSGR